MILKTVFGVFILNLICVLSNKILSDVLQKEKEEQRMEVLTAIITANKQTNSWSVVLTVGSFPNILYKMLTQMNVSFAVTNNENSDHDFEDIVQYYSNTILISFIDYKDFEKSLSKAMASPYWHPLSNIILYFHNSDEKIVIAKMFFILWFYSCPNAILVQYENNNLLVSLYSPYIYQNYQLDNNFGCYSLKILGSSVAGFGGGFKCEDTCNNVTNVKSKLRANNLGTCIGFSTYYVPLHDYEHLVENNIFEDKSKDLHGFIMRANGLEVPPFLVIDDLGEGRYSLRSRDGMMWNTLSKLMNFSIDMSSNEHVKSNFDFVTSVNQIFGFAHRKADLFLIPIYQMPLVVVEYDMTVPYKASGVCIMSHRADFETVLFDIKVVQENYDLCLRFASCFIAMWLFYIIFNAFEMKKFDYNQVGKDLLNTIRNVLSISVINSSERKSFRIFLAFSIWSFFIINFSTQAAITSFFTAFKRGKEVETFQDIVDKGYAIEGMETPDIILPDDEEIFVEINSKFKAIQDIFGCVKELANDSQKFCLIDCACAQYMEKNWLDSKGEQYLHIAKDRIHSNYLNLMMPKNSPLTQQINKHVIRLIEAGIVSKWEQFKFKSIKDEVSVNTLKMEDVIGIFQCYLMLTGISFICFTFEMLICITKKIIQQGAIQFRIWKRTKIAKAKLKLDHNHGKIKIIHSSTQTSFSHA